MDIFESLLYAGLLVVIFPVLFRLFTLPIEIGEYKGLSRREMKRIRLFTWFGLVTGVLWFIALVLALTGEKDASS